MKPIVLTGVILVFVVFSFHAAIAATPPPAPPGMVLIPGGSFMMGCTENDADCFDDEKPAHHVTVEAFYISQSEVSLGEYQKCIEAGACTRLKSINENRACYIGEAKRDDCAANCVNWWQANSYCEWQGGRLPTEAEWEYASRGGHQDWKFPWGNENPDCSRVIAGAIENNFEYCTGIAGSKPANAYGLFDIAGNLWEWVADCWHQDYQDAPSSSQLWNGGDCSKRVTRGGSWDDDETRYFRNSNRHWNYPHNAHGGSGFRCAKSIQ